MTRVRINQRVNHKEEPLRKLSHQARKEKMQKAREIQKQIKRMLRIEHSQHLLIRRGSLLPKEQKLKRLRARKVSLHRVPKKESR